ncbi:MAG TPA: adenylyltransferase/cytidyltransferase family protein [Acidimicrobiales bacterium]|nr:adenylyltransferase/cytidyltransferase family protein [Acidimicrobiales bacterium]
MTRVYVDMVADLFHPGHVEFLRKAKSLGDALVVGIHTDDAVESYKRRPLMTMTERMAVVAGCRYVDEVVANAPLAVNQDWLKTHRIDLVVHGDDFDDHTAAKYYAVAMEMGIYRTVPYTPGVSTTELLVRLRQRIEEEAASS